MARITLIGAGSVEFTRGLSADLMSFDGLGPVHLMLHDIDEDRLATAEAICRRTQETTGADFTISSSLDRSQALVDADYVINEIQVGGYEATLKDFEIPAKYGLRQTIGDTLGIGGIFRGLRTMPVMIAIGKDMARICPDALLLTYTNPMAMLPWSVYEGSPFQNVFGLCHSVRDTHQMLARTVGEDVDSVSFTTAGLNHQAFVLRFTKDGRDLYPAFDTAIENDPEMQRKVRAEIYRRFGYYPTESSEHSAEYVPWFMHSDEMIERFRIPVDEYLRRSEDNLETYAAVKEEVESSEPFKLEPNWELASQIIHSIEANEPRTIYCNVKNTALIENLPWGCCVEVPCLVDQDGIRPTHVGELPPQLAALNRTFLNVVELTVRAVLDGDRRLVYQAAMLDPNTAATLTLDEIRSMCDELIAAHEGFMPDGIA